MPWGKFWRLLARISASSDSHYSKAMRDDPDLAASVAARSSDDDPPWRPPLADWTLLHELLQINNDRLGQLAALIADLPIGVKQRHDPPKALPRPQTALDREMDRVRKGREQAYDDRVLDFAEKAKQRWRENQLRAADG